MRFFRPLRPVLLAAWLLALMGAVPVAAAHDPCGPGPAGPFGEHVGSSHHCRFWGCASDNIPAGVIEEHLITLPNSIENLSVANPDGWSVGYFCCGDSVPVVDRGPLPAHLDSLFDCSVHGAAGAHPHIAVSHIRQCSSGLCDIPDPHPFERCKNGRHWLMGHNGTIDKDILLDLIRPDYLAANPPEYGENASEWIDSELYFLYMLQTFEDLSWEVKWGLGEVVERLRQEIPGNDEALNFFLTDGVSLWAYREGRTLYYVYDVTGTPYAAVASTYPCIPQQDWVMMFDGQLITMKPGAAPEVENIQDYFDAASVSVGDPPSEATGSVGFTTRPNPFSRLVTIEYDLPRPAPVTLEVYDISGRLVRVIMDGAMHGAGRQAIQWDGPHDSGRAAPPGIYFYRFRAGPSEQARRGILLR